VYINIVWHEEGMDQAISENLISIVIDVLRGSTTIIALKAMKCSKIISFESGSEVLNAYDSVSDEKEKRKTFLVGEKRGLMEQGFHFCNSPTQIINNSDSFRSSIIFFKSTNISKVINRYKSGLTTFIGSIANCSSVAERAYKVAKRNRTDIILIPVGRCTRFFKRKDLEDEIATILMMRKLLRYECVKLSGCADILYRKTKHLSDGTLAKNISHTKSARYLKDIGYGNDIILSSKIDYFENVVPALGIDVVIRYL